MLHNRPAALTDNSPADSAAGAQRVRDVVSGSIRTRPAAATAFEKHDKAIVHIPRIEPAVAQGIAVTQSMRAMVYNGPKTELSVIGEI